MFQNLLLLMSPESAVVPSAVQATLHMPPAESSAAAVTTSRQIHAVKFVVSVAGNTIGFAGILAACWLSLQLLQSVM